MQKQCHHQKARNHKRWEGCLSCYYYQNGQTEILSLYSVILLLHPYFPAFPLCFNYLKEFVPRLSHESDMALIFSSGKQILDNYLC